MSIVYNEFVKNFNEGKSDWFDSGELRLYFVNSDYKPNKEHTIRDIESFILPYGLIRIKSGRVENDENQTMYFIDDLKGIRTHAAKYMLFMDNCSKGVICLKDELPINYKPMTIQFHGQPLFLIDRTGNVRFQMSTKSVRVKTGKHKLVISGGEK